jgi:hypothetical protein
MKKLLTCAILLSFATLAYGYATFNNVKWGTLPLRYSINTTNSEGLSASQLIIDIKNAANAWSTQSGSSATATYLGTTSACGSAYDLANIICFRDTGGGPIAVTNGWSDSSGHIVDSDMTIFEDYSEFTSDQACDAGYYVLDVTTHEWGHMFGLAHSSVGTATMYPTSGACDTGLRSLDPDDIAGIKFLYPGSAPPPPPPTPTAPLTPNNPSPASGSTRAHGKPVNLTWSASGATSYVVTLNGTAHATTKASYNAGKLAAGSYTWSVVAYNTVGSTAGPSWTFTIP